MSYCRWSCDDFQCDVYAYPHVDGYFAIHVATNRRIFDKELPPPLPENCTIEDFIQRDMKVQALCDSSRMEKIGGPLDGESYDEPDAASAADRLETIRAAGYNVPQYAIDELREEASKEDDHE